MYRHASGISMLPACRYEAKAKVDKERYAAAMAAWKAGGASAAAAAADGDEGDGDGDDAGDGDDE